MLSNCNWITPNWPIPSHVKALTTLRSGGVSLTPFDSFNLAMHVGDAPTAVLQNRDILQKSAKLPTKPLWLKQVHGIEVVTAEDFSSEETPEADAAIAFHPNQICTVLTADCLPILLCDQKGSKIGAVHAGWKGLAQGVIEATVEKLSPNPENLLAWLGPAIGPESFEVREEVHSVFSQVDERKAFRPFGQEAWLLDIYYLAKLRLMRLGIKQIFGGGYCTYRESDRFYSFRRDKITGRMATLIWFENKKPA